MNVLAVANYFLDLADRDAIPVNQLKLQKLVYIAHGWHLAITNRPLFDDEIVAWPHGPVIPKLYHEFKHCGDEEILTRGFEYRPELDEVHEFSLNSDDSNLTVDQLLETTRILNRVWEQYHRFTDSQLSQMTHQQNTPWYEIAKNKTRTEFKNLPIHNEMIQQHYSKLATTG
jgi:uncharacterized phage-associated protein